MVYVEDAEIIMKDVSWYHEVLCVLVCSEDHNACWVSSLFSDDPEGDGVECDVQTRRLVGETWAAQQPNPEGDRGSRSNSLTLQ